MGYALSGKTALVTGANRGIGEAMVDAVVAAGVRKVSAAARSIAALDPLVARHGSRVTPLQLDVTNAAQIAAAAATAADVDLLVNNAGIVGFFGGEFTDPKWIEGGRQEMEVNFLGTFAVTQAFAPVLAKNGGGAIANLNSVASFVSFPILAAYSASKAATHSLTQVTRAMLRGQNTQVFGVYPGPIDTKMGEVLTLEKASPADAGLATCQPRSCARMTFWSRFTPLVSTFWIPNSETASSNVFCRIACRSFWAMTWPASWSGSELECVDSSPATKSMRGRLTGESVHSRNSVRSKKMTWRSSPKHSPWKKRLPSPWSA